MPMEEKVSSSSFRGLGSKTMREKEVREGALSFMSSALLTLIHDYDEGADKETQQLLTHVAGGEQEQAEAMLKTNPLLVFEKGDVTDLSKRSFKNITAFQYALWALDWHMWTMLLAYLPQEEAALQWRELETNSTAHGKHANWQELIDAYAAYPQNNTSKYWIEQIGTKQLLLPAHVVNEYCHEQRGFHPLPDFGSGNKLPRSRVVAGIDWYDADEEWRYPRAQVRSFGAYCFSLGPLFSIQASQPEVSYAEHDRKAIASLLETRQCQRAELAKTLSPLLLTSTHTNPR